MCQLTMALCEWMDYIATINIYTQYIIYINSKRHNDYLGFAHYFNIIIINDKTCLFKGHMTLFKHINIFGTGRWRILSWKPPANWRKNNSMFNIEYNPPPAKNIDMFEKCHMPFKRCCQETFWKSHKNIEKNFRQISAIHIHTVLVVHQYKLSWNGFFNFNTLNNDRLFEILWIAQNDDEEPNKFHCNVVPDSGLQSFTIDKCWFLSNHMMAKTHHHTLP